MAPVVKPMDSIGSNKSQQERQIALADAVLSSCNNAQNSIVATDLAPDINAIIISSGKPNDFEK